jgi:hypothetical protein
MTRSGAFSSPAIPPASSTPFSSYESLPQSIRWQDSRWIAGESNAGFKSISLAPGC